jgi:hypothetical protein
MSEKDLILRGWEGLDEDAVVREVATKGKYIDLCLSYLATKKKFTESDARIYFEQKVMGELTLVQKTFNVLHVHSKRN